MLVSVPLRDQLNEPVTDHQPDENASANCVPAALSAALTALTGQAYYGDELKDAAYGEAYTGATDPARFVAYAAAQGVRMWEVRGNTGAELVATVKAELARGHPVYGAIPSFWGNTTAADIAARGGPTHAVMFCDAHPAGDTLTAMNPWPVDGHNAFYQTMSAAWWASRLVYGHVYPLARVATATDEPGALWLPSPHFWAGANQPRYVVVHGTGYTLSQTAADVAHDFATTNSNSTHYAVDRAGQVAQMVREKDAAWGNGVLSAGHDPWWSGNPNHYTISIEHVNDAQNSTPLSGAQQQASFRLIRDICTRHGIPMRPADATGGIAGHYSIDPVNRAHCPGAYPWSELWAYLKGDSSMAFTRQPDGSARDDQTGVVLRFGMAAYVLDNDVQQHALLAESYYDGANSFVPCDGGLILTYNRGENAVRADHGGEALVAVWNQLAAAHAGATAATAQVRDLAAQVATLQAELTQARQTSPGSTPDATSTAAVAAVRALATALADAAGRAS